MKKRIAAFLVTALLVFALLPAEALAKTRTILALGDSISAGYGLADIEKECFVYLLSADGDPVINKAVSGNRAADILDQLHNKDNLNYVSPALIRSADVVTITCGGNDLMDVLYEKAAEIWNAENPNKQVEADGITSMFASGMTADALGLIGIALNLLDSKSSSYMINDPVFSAKLEEYIDALLEITAYIHGVNPLAEIIVATQYNPYVEFKGVTISVPVLFFSIDLALDPLYSGIEDGAAMLNDAIRDHAAEGGYSVTEVKQAFDSCSDTRDLSNARAELPGIDMDFHPTAAGHALIAECFRAELKKPRYLRITDKDGVCHEVELPFDQNVTVLAVGYTDSGAMTDILVRICSGRNYSGEFSGSRIQVFFLKTGTLQPAGETIRLK